MKISITAVMHSNTSAAARVNRPRTSRTGVVNSIAKAMYAASTGGNSGTLYSSVKSEIAVSQLASFAIAEFQNTVATASRSGSARTAEGTRSSHDSARPKPAPTAKEDADVAGLVSRLQLHLSNPPLHTGTARLR